jgi:hypothetical protein
MIHEFQSHPHTQNCMMMIPEMKQRIHLNASSIGIMANPLTE